jgi:class 3 adenylate cyclase
MYCTTDAIEANDNFTWPLSKSLLQLTITNRTGTRALPVVWIENRAFDELVGKRRPNLTAKRIFTNQTFRDLYRTDTLDVDQGLKIVSLTFLFTDLKGSTELYARVGDLVAYELVRRHFHLLTDIVATGGGSVVKTIGDAVMATFPTPDRALAAALQMRKAIELVGNEPRKEDMLLKIGLHEGPCLAVMLNDKLDYFGQTVNIAARIQGLASSRAIFASKSIVEYPQSSLVLQDAGIAPSRQSTKLKGVAGEVAVYKIP